MFIQNISAVKQAHTFHSQQLSIIKILMVNNSKHLSMLGKYGGLGKYLKSKTDLQHEKEPVNFFFIFNILERYPV